MHGSNLKSLHDAISPECLPKEYGGTAGDFKTFTGKDLKYLLHLMLLRSQLNSR